MTYTVSPSQTFPYSAVCLITTRIGGETFRGSGVAIGPHTILTASHMIWDATTELTASSGSIYLGVSGSSAPSTASATASFGPNTVHYLTVGNPGGTMSQAGSAYDFAVIDVPVTFSSWFNLLPNYTGGVVNATGYPAYPSGVEVGLSSWQQWTATGSVSVDSNFDVLDYGTLTVQAGNSGGPLWVDTGTASNPHPSVVGLVSTSGYAAELTTSTLNMINDWIASDSYLWTIGPAASAGVSKFVGQETAARQSFGWTTDLETAGISSNSRYNSVIGWQSADFHSGNDAVVLDGARSEYQLRVDGDGQLAVTDTLTGGRIVVSGASYVVFDGASGAGAGSYDQILFIEGGAGGGDAALARLYQAAFGRIPDLAGLEWWKAQLDTGAQSLDQIAGQFIGSTEFGARYGTHTTNAEFLTALYENVLGRDPDAGGMAWWQATLDGGTETRSQVLQGFASSQECINKVAGWLVDTSQGGYADSGALMDAATVLNQADQSHVVNMALIDPATITAKDICSYDYSYSAGFWLSSTTIGTYDDGAKITMAGATAGAVLCGDNDAIFGSTATTSIQCYGSNETVVLASAAHTKVSMSAGSATVDNFVPGSDVFAVWFKFVSQTAVLINDSAGQTTNGAGLDFINHFYIVDVGAVGGGTAAEVAAAANKVYTLAGSAWTNLLWSERLEVIGQSSSGDTVIYGFYESLSNPDTNGNHKVDAGELTYIAKLVGVQTASLTAHDLA